MPALSSPPFESAVSQASPAPVSEGEERPRPSEAEAGAKQEAQERMEQLRGEMMRALEILHAVQALFEVKRGVSRAEFSRFVQSALRRLPELQALEWIPRVPLVERERYEQAAVADGLAGFSFTEIDPAGQIAPAGMREAYWPVFYVEPALPNTPVLGLDLWADPRRREALDRAARTGLPTATSPLKLAQLQDHRLGFLVVMSVRDPGADEVAGFCLAVFRVERLVEAVFAPLVARGVRVEIRDMAEGGVPIYSAGHSPAVEPTWSYERELPLVGRVWHFRFTPDATFASADPGWLRRAAETLHRANEVLEARVAERTAELEKSNASLRAEIARREQAEAALRLADEKLTLLTETEARNWGMAGFVGRSAAFGRLLHELKRVQAFPRTNVLLTGESGTGKELIARAVHFGGPAATGPFIAVNCSALPGDLLESHFFGHVRGAFTGAVADRKGYLELAHQGTLFLDEIGDMPVALQAKLLRVLEDGEVTPIGASVARRVVVRVVAATNVDLPARIATGAFRHDLYHRLMHFHLQVPPLRDRLEDVPALALHFVKRFASDLKLTPPALRLDAVDRLLAHAYPGNIRELKNTIERAMIHAGGGEIRADHITFSPQTTTIAATATGTAGAAGEEDPAGFNLAEAEDRLIRRALAVTGGNLSASARLLGINRATLHRWKQTH